jgi:hypothetical protein
MRFSRRAGAGKSIHGKINLKARGAADLRRDSAAGCNRSFGSAVFMQGQN